MRRSKLSSLFGILLAGASCAWLPGCASCGRTTSSDMDINSGDYRYQEYRGHQLVKDVISESALSKEARRLGIRLPAERKWEPMARSRPGKLFSDYGRKYEDYTYGFLLSVCNDLVRILAETNTPDGERHTILGKFLTMLRTDNPDQVMYEGYFLVLDIGDKCGVHIYAAQFEKQLTEMRSKKQSQTLAP